MDLNTIKEIGFLHNIKVEDTNNNTIEKRDLIIFILTNNTTKYLDIDAGRELTEYEKVLTNPKTKIDKIYKNKEIKLKEFENSHPSLDIIIENRHFESHKKRGKK